MKKLLPFLVFLLLLPAGCVRQTPVLAAAATPAPTPETHAFTQSVLIPGPTDALGAPIDGEDHYERYLSFTNMRIFEYEGGTLMEGVCENAYPETLTGAYEMVFSDKDGAVLARADVLTHAEGNAFLPGENTVYAKIDTDMNILMTPFQLIVKEQITPKAA